MFHSAYLIFFANSFKYLPKTNIKEYDVSLAETKEREEIFKLLAGGYWLLANLFLQLAQNCRIIAYFCAVFAKFIEKFATCCIMPKKKSTENVINLDNILFNCTRHSACGTQFRFVF